MKHHLFILTFTCYILHFCASTVLAQTGTCEQSLGEAYLDAGNVRARILNNGGLFWRGSPHVYTVPKDGNANAIFSGSIWIGGLIDEQLRMAASTYGPWDFWAGPLDENGNPPADCTPYDQLWEIRTEDIAAYLNKGEISENLQNWPRHLGAPVIDGDGNPDNYNLEGGDLPELLGDQRLWWIMNDRGNVHERTRTEPIGLEVHASAFAFNNAGVLGNQTFYAYKLINKNELPLTDTHFGLYVDMDLGDFSDDYVGSDSLLHLGFAYNADNEDGSSRGYGIAPPALGFTFLGTIDKETDGLDNDRDGEVDEAGEKLGTSAVMFYNSGGGVTGDPATASDFYNVMQAQWKDGESIVEGLYGRYDRNWPAHLPVKPVKFYYPGDPVTQSFWSELNWDGLGQAFSPADRRLATSSGPFEIASGDTVEINFAILWARGDDNLDSITSLREVTTAVRSTGTSLFKPVRVNPLPQPPPNYVLGFDQNFPNPFSQSTTLRYSLPKTMQVRLAVYDLLGRQVELLVDARQEAGIYTVEYDAGALPAGVYLARIELDHLRFTHRMLLVR